LKYIRAAVLAIAAVALTGVLAQPARADVSFDFAYSNLSQHGSWLVSAQYGHVWQPREYNREWNPYYDGHWVDTDMGWTWVSDYQWGAIPYHYGTWVADPRYGWVWIPGQVWAPSWVVFRTTPEYIGWAPVPPGFSVGVSIGFGAPSSFIYVSSRNFLAPRLRTAIIPAAQTTVFINNTTVINNIVIQNDIVMNRGPDVRMIEQATGRAVPRQSIEQVTRVAPFEHVSRAELAVTPERVKRGVRVADPVPASQPLPVAGQQGQPNKQGKGSAPVAAQAPVGSQGGHQAQAPPSATSAPAPPVAKNKSNAQHKNSQQAPVEAQKAPHAQPAPHPAAAPTPTPAPPKDKASAQHKNSQQAPVEAQKAPHAQPAPHPAAAPTPAPPTDKASAQQSAKAQPKANPQADAKAKADSKAKADAKAKKDNPEKKADDADKGTTEKPSKQPEQQ